MNGQQLRILERVAARHTRNLMKWDGYVRTPAEHLLIAAEEFGEVARAMQTHGDDYEWPPVYNEQVLEELIDLMAVLLFMAADCERA